MTHLNFKNDYAYVNGLKMYYETYGCLSVVFNFFFCGLMLIWLFKKAAIIFSHSAIFF